MTGLEIEVIGIVRIDELQPEGLHGGRLVRNLGDAHQIGQIDIRLGHRYTS